MEVIYIKNKWIYVLFFSQFPVVITACSFNSVKCDSNACSCEGMVVVGRGGGAYYLCLGRICRDVNIICYTPLGVRSVKKREREIKRLWFWLLSHSTCWTVDSGSAAPAGSSAPWLMQSHVDAPSVRKNKWTKDTENAHLRVYIIGMRDPSSVQSSPSLFSSVFGNNSSFHFCACCKRPY